MKRLFFFAVIGGCSYLEQPVSEKIIKKGWGRTCPVQKESYYCYRTLGECVCYKNPLPNSHNRLSGQPNVYKKVPIKPKTGCVAHK
jgi:hypothetical protein